MLLHPKPKRQNESFPNALFSRGNKKIQQQETKDNKTSRQKTMRLTYKCIHVYLSTKCVALNKSVHCFHQNTSNTIPSINFYHSNNHSHI